MKGSSTKPIVAQANERLQYLDGIRGCGALFVCFMHAFAAGLENGWWYIPATIPFNGHFAVVLFFTVSGIALSASFVKRGDIYSLLRLGLSRYFRLALPIVATTVLVYIAIRLKLFHGVPPAEAKLIPARLSFERNPVSDTSLWHAVRYALFDVFWSGPHASIVYDYPLWTMRIEMIGSFLIFGFLLLIRSRTVRSLVAVIIWVLSIVLLDYPGFGRNEDSLSYYGYFFLGYLLAEALVVESIVVSKGAKIVMASLGFSTAVFFPFIREYTTSQMEYVSVLLFLPGLLFLEIPRKVLSSKFCSFLGKISFPLYLSHAPVLNLVTLPLWHLTGNVLFAALLAVASAIAVAVVIVSPCNEISMVASRRIGEILTGRVMQVWAYLAGKMSREGGTFAKLWWSLGNRVRIEIARPLFWAVISIPGLLVWVWAAEQPVQTVDHIAISEVRLDGDIYRIRALKRKDILAPRFFDLTNLAADEAPVLLNVSKELIRHYSGNAAEGMPLNSYWYDKNAGEVLYRPEKGDVRNAIDEWELVYPFNVRKSVILLISFSSVSSLMFLGSLIARSQIKAGDRTTTGEPGSASTGDV
jgi:peptidoglycan/LPS O-acetylase OafA/YrhL